MKARTYVKQLMTEAGLTIREDTMGSIYGVLPGANPAAPSVSTGSHCDAIPLAGAYDGTTGALRCAVLCCTVLCCAVCCAAPRPAAHATAGDAQLPGAVSPSAQHPAARRAAVPPPCMHPQVEALTRCPPSYLLPATTHTGVIGGIAALKALKDAGFVPARPLEVVMFNSEEPTRFGLSCSGSRAMAGGWLGGWEGAAWGGCYSAAGGSGAAAAAPRQVGGWVGPGVGATALKGGPGAAPANKGQHMYLAIAAGVLEAEYLDSRRDENGTSFLAAAQGAGYGASTYAEMLAGARRTPADLAYFVELHIEQVGWLVGWLAGWLVGACCLCPVHVLARCLVAVALVESVAPTGVPPLLSYVCRLLFPMCAAGTAAGGEGAADWRGHRHCCTRGTARPVLRCVAGWLGGCHLYCVLRGTA
jgi:hypothetical protein